MMWIVIMAVGFAVAGIIAAAFGYALYQASEKIDALEGRARVLLPLAEERRLLELRLGAMARREDALWKALTARDVAIRRPKVELAGTASWWHYDEYFRELEFNKYEPNHGGVQLAKRVAPWPTVPPEGATPSSIYEGPISNE